MNEELKEKFLKTDDNSLTNEKTKTINKTKFMQQFILKSFIISIS